MTNTDKYNEKKIEEIDLGNGNTTRIIHQSQAEIDREKKLKKEHELRDEQYRRGNTSVIISGKHEERMDILERTITELQIEIAKLKAVKQF